MALKKLYYSATDVMQLLNISITTLEKWVAKGLLPQPVRPSGPRGKKWFNAAEVDRCIERLNNTPRGA
jgi:predicted site-specific integrase-resolvase